MPRFHRVFAAALLSGLAACSGAGERTPPPRPANGTEAPAPAPALSSGKRAPIVTASAFSDSPEIVPGVPFRVGVKFAIPEGWHIYGKEPGDAGFPTRIRVVPPEGFSVGDVEYPPAERFEAPGNIVSFGYVREAQLRSTLTPPVVVSGARVPVSIEATWLACKDLCVKESATLHLDLPVTPSPGVKR